jgi:hypothetical protein
LIFHLFSSAYPTGNRTGASDIHRNITLNYLIYQLKQRREANTMNTFCNLLLSLIFKLKFKENPDFFSWRRRFKIEDRSKRERIDYSSSK